MEASPIISTVERMVNEKTTKTYVYHRKHVKGGKVYCYLIEVKERTLGKCQEHSSKD